MEGISDDLFAGQVLRACEGHQDHSDTDGRMVLGSWWRLTVVAAVFLLIFPND